MGPHARSGVRGPVNRFWRWRGFALRLACCFLFEFGTTVFVGLAPEANFLWVANGVMLAYFLLAPRRRWPFYFGAGFLAQFSAGLLAGHHAVFTGILLTLLNLGEALLGAFLLRRRSTDLPDFTSPRYIFRFLLLGVFLSPAVMGALDVFLTPLLHAESPLWHTSSALVGFVQWVASDALGTGVATPACVAIFRTRFRDSVASARHWAYVLLITLFAVATFSQTYIPVSFLLFPILVLILLRLGLGWASLASVCVSAVGSFFTFRGVGPFAFSRAGSPLRAVFLLQLLTASSTIILYSVSVVISHLRNTERRLQQIVDLHNLVTGNSRDLIVVADFDGDRTFVSSSDCQWLGWSCDELKACKTADLVHPEDRPLLARTIQELRKGRETALIEYRVQTRAGDYAWTECSLKAIRDSKTGMAIGVLNNARDISERKTVEQTRQFQLSLINAILAVSLDGVLVVNAEGNIVSSNRRMGDLWRIDLPEQFHGTILDEPLPHEHCLNKTVAQTKDPQAFLDRVNALYRNPSLDDRFQTELKDGRTLETYSTPLRDGTGKYFGRVWFFRDISQHKLTEQRLQEAYYAVESLAITDALTGLANRRHFDQSLTTEWRRCMRDRSPLSLILIDVDQFKSYNDIYGHLHGDQCLRQIAAAMQEVARRSGDLSARFGGEEFAIIMPKTSNASAVEIAESVRAALRQHDLPHAGNPAGTVTISIGCATVTPQLGQSPSSLVELADQALYQAKRAGRDRVCTANPSTSSEIQRPIPIRITGSK